MFDEDLLEFNFKEAKDYACKNIYSLYEASRALCDKSSQQSLTDDDLCSFSDVLHEAVEKSSPYCKSEKVL